MRKTASLLVMLAGCGVGPGDWALFRLTESTTTLAGDCWYPADGPSPDEVDDIDSSQQASTVAVFRDADGGWYLDDGSVVMVGIQDRPEVTFAYQQRDVSYTAPDGTGDKYIADESYTLVAAFQGDVMTGQRTASLTITCEGATCGELPDVCTNTASVVGVRVPDADVIWPPGA